MTPMNPRISATAMVYGLDIQENLLRLRKYVSHTEILLYWTPNEHNFPDKARALAIKTLADELGLRLSVHLPPMLDLVTGEAATCRRHLDILLQLLETLAIWQPTAYVLHVGPNPPVICSNTTDYIHFASRRNLTAWHARTCDVLAEIQAAYGLGPRLLVENLDFSPLLLKPFAERGLAAICLDAGHVWLGNEDLKTAFAACAPHIKEMHLHGVHNGREHLSLTATTAERLKILQELLQSAEFTGMLNLEVFTEADFKTSLNWLYEFV